MLKLIPEVDFDIKLNMTEKNAENTQAFIERGVKDFSLPGFVTPHGYRLLTSVSGNQYRLVTDADMPGTVYAVKLEFMEQIVPSKKHAHRYLCGVRSFLNMTGLCEVYHKSFLNFSLKDTPLLCLTVSKR